MLPHPDRRPSFRQALAAFVAVIGWTGAAPLAAQDHAPAAKDAHAPVKAESRKTPTADAGHAPAAHGGGPRTAAHPDAVRPAGGQELDAVMQRINRRISATAGATAGAAAVPAAPRPATRAPEAHDRARPAAGGHGASPSALANRGTAAPAVPTPRVRLTWRLKIVWPRALIDGTGSRTDIAWTPALQ